MTSVLVFSQSCKWIWSDFGLMLRLVGLMKLILCPVWSIFKGENTAEMIWWKEVNVGLYSDMYRLISFKFGMMIDTTKLYRLIPLWMTSTVTESHIYMRMQKLLHSFSQKFLCSFGWNLECYNDLLVCSRSCFFCCCCFVLFFAWLIFKGENCTMLVLKRICYKKS